MPAARILAVGLLLALAPGPAAADDPAIEGLVAEACASCHEVPGRGPLEPGLEPGRADAPPFVEIAEQPTRYTAARIRAFLRQPHYPMTGLALSPDEVEALAGYIESLRGRTPWRPQP